MFPSQTIIDTWNEQIKMWNRRECCTLSKHRVYFFHVQGAGLRTLRVPKNLDNQTLEIPN